MMRRMWVVIAGWVVIIGAVSAVQSAGVWATEPQQRPAEASAPASSPQRALLDRYCLTCHNDRRLALSTVPVSFEGLDVAEVGANAEVWEKVVRKLHAGGMPPAGRPRPDQETHDGFITWLETQLDLAAEVRPDPGRPVMRRLTQAEYVNAIRDLLAVEIDVQSLLFPADDLDQHGFDTNGGVLSVSPALMERYLAAARRISRLAVGDPTIGPGFAAATYAVPKMLFQNDRLSEDLPFGSRGGLAIRHNFPLDGEYGITIRLRRQIYDYVIGMGTEQQLDVRVDGERVARFTVGGGVRDGASAYTFFGTIRGTPEWEDYVSHADAGLDIRFQAKAGLRVVGVSFVKHLAEPTGVRERRLSGFSLSGADFYTDNAAVESVALSGPYTAAGPGETRSRQRIFVCRPADGTDEEPCARTILAGLARRAYRRPVTDGDLQPLLSAYTTGRSEGAFDTGIQFAIERMLVDPAFLFRAEHDPANVAPRTVYRLTDFELATRVALFVWASIPDDELLDVAERGELHDPQVLEQQVRRMLADPRSTALVENFASQWLQVNRMRGVTPDPDVFPDFDENLRADFQRETKLFVGSVLREDHSVVELLTANYTFVNERLAAHYGIPNVYGERFRRVTVDTEARGGLLGQGSLLTVTSYPTRTSPVLRGKWILDNILGTPPPPPPSDVPALEESNSDGPPRSVREQMEEHQQNPVCASCHRIIDPLGFSLEHFDALGRWRAMSEAGTPIDAAGTLVDGTAVDGLAALRQALVHQPDAFVRNVTEKLLTYVLGRGLEYYDQPAVRTITRAAAADDYRWSSIIVEIAKSVPFQYRRTEL